MRKTIVFAGVLAALSLLLVFSIACGGGGEGGPKTYKVRQDAKAGNAVWRVSSVQKTNQFTKKDGTGVIKAQGVFVLVEMQMKNAGAEAAVLTGEELELLDEENKAYSFDSRNNSVYLSAIGKENLIAGTVASGQTAKGFIIFDVSKDAKGFKLKARDIDIRSNKYVFIDLGI